MKGKAAFLISLAAVHYLVLFFFASFIPHRIVYLFFLFTMVIVPGEVIAASVFPRLRLHFRLLISFVFGTAGLFALIFIATVFRLNLFCIGIIMPVISILLVFLLPPAGERMLTERKSIIQDYHLSRPAAVLLVLILAAVSIMIIIVGDPLIYPGDSPDQIAYIRTVSRTGEAFPEQFLHIEGGGLTRDIRKGLIHSMWGLFNLMTGRVDTVNIWSLISMTGSVFLLLAIFCLAIQYFRSDAVALASVIIFILYYHGGLGSRQLITVAYGFPFGKIYFYAFMAFLPAALRNPRRDVLVLIAAASFAATGTHVTHILLMVLVFLIFAGTEFFQSAPAEKKSLLRTNSPLLAAVLAATNLPYLLLRYLRDYNPANVIHTHKQGAFIFSEGIEVVNPVVFMLSGGVLVVVSFFSVFILWKKSRSNRNLRLLLCTAAAVYILSFNPLWVSFLMERISYLFFRFETAAVTMVISAFLLKAVWDGLAGKNNALSRGRAFFGALVLLAALLPPLISLPDDFAYAGSGLEAAEEISCRNLSDLYEAVDELIPEGSVIASDPVTSYCIPAFCDQFVVCTYDQHSIPNDSTALDRIMACRDIYLPGTGCSEIAASLEEYRTEYIIINGRIPPSIRTKYWRPGAGAADQAEDRLTDCGERYQRFYHENDISIFRFDPGAEPVSVSEDTRSDYPGGSPERRGNLHGTGLIPSGTGGIYITGYRLESSEISRGDTLRLKIGWLANAEIPPSSYRIHIRFDTEFPRGPLFSDTYGKLYRKIVEKLRGKRYRFRRSRLPFDGVYPPDRWPFGKEILEEFELPVPRDIAAGRYVISVRMGEKTQYPNYTLKDIFTDDDIYDGPDIAEVEIK